jgi:NitT/TauT family transport system ATP-binding protein
MLEPMLHCRSLGVVYPGDGPGVPALTDVSFTVHQAEFVSIVGPSGCGKTTLLRVLAGVLLPTEGSVNFNHMPVEASVVFQEKSLFPWMTAVENAAFGLEMKNVPRAQREAQATSMLARFGLAGRERAYPHQLSSGMKQRVAIARAFLGGAPLLLMDEPFGALDCQTRWMAQQELASLWREDRKTVVFVTHDVDEAIRLSDRILVLSEAPGTVAAEYPVRAAHPRDFFIERDDQLLSLKRRILTSLKLTAENPLPAYLR